MPSLNTGNAILSNPIKVDSSYNVGIGGAASGSFKLQVTGTTNLTGALSGTSATFSGNGLFGGSTNAGNAGAFTLSVGVPGTTAGGIQLWAATNQSSFLQFGDSTTSADNYRGYVGYNHATDTLSLGTASTDKLTIASTGAATFSSSVSARSGLTGTITAITTNDASGYGVGLGYVSGGYGYVTSQSASSPLVLAIDGGEKMRITTGGNVGIGVSSPTERLEILGPDGSGAAVRWRMAGGRKSGYLYSDSAGVAIYDTNLNDAGIYIAQNTQIDFRVNGSQRMLINSSGNVGIGTSSPTEILHLNSSNTAAFIRFQNTGGSGTYLGSRNDNMEIYTGGSEKMRITSGGQLLINTTTNSSDPNLRLQVNGIIASLGTANSLMFQNRTSTNTYEWYATSGTIYIYSSGGAANILSINGSNGTYTALSDVNKKKDFEDSTIGLEAILGLKPTLYRMKGDETEGNKELGFIAQEVKEFIPQAFVESGDDNNKFIGLNYNAIVAALVKSVQEQQAQIEAQQQQINSLINR